MKYNNIKIILKSFRTFVYIHKYKQKTKQIWVN